MDPQQRLTLSHYRQLVEYCLQHGFEFISADDARRGLAPAKRYAMLSFDDGYFNNLRLLPLLQEYRIPAVFSISTWHATEQRAFWWDVLYREGRKRGKSAPEIYRQGVTFKSWKHERINQYLTEAFGERALVPVSDLDRALTTSELRDFARHPGVCIGNHTHNHASLTQYSATEVRTQVLTAQEILQSVTGRLPHLIAYPYGLYSPQTIEVIRSLGLQLGLTCYPEKSYLPLDFDHGRNLQLGRFLPVADTALAGQLGYFRSDLMLYPRLRRLKQTFRQR